MGTNRLEETDGNWARPAIRIRWAQLLGFVVLTAIFSLSVHVLMLDVLGIPHPSAEHVGQMAVLLNESLRVIAMITFYRIALSDFERASLILRWLLLAAVVAMLNEALLRDFIMDVVVSHDWIYCLAENMAAPLIYLGALILIVTAGRLIVTAAPYLSSPWPPG